MARGRRPEPAAVAEAKGNPGKRRRRADAVPEPGALDGAPPGQLGPAAQRVWSMLAPELVRLKLLRLTDAPAFARYCENLARWWDIQQALGGRAKLTYWTESAHGKLKRIEPLFLIQDRIEKRLAELEDRFGLTPAARQRILLQMAARPAELPFGDGPTPDDAGAGEGAAVPPAEAPAESPVGLLERASGRLH